MFAIIMSINVEKIYRERSTNEIFLLARLYRDHLVDVRMEGKKKQHVIEMGAERRSGKGD